MGDVGVAIIREEKTIKKLQNFEIKKCFLKNTNLNHNPIHNKHF